MITDRIARAASERTLRAVDERLRLSAFTRKALAYVFPDHWSFMLGEIALYSFLILVATGVFLAAFFEPSLAERLYTGSYTPERGQQLPAAYASTLELSWDVPSGLLIRQVHHWAAHIFIGSIIVHLCRIFFTAMFRKPRELNWMVGVTLFMLAILNGYAGYSLPDDLLSGTGLHIGFAVILSVPVIGPWMAFMIFGRGFPGDIVIERLYIAHVLVIPGLIALLITIHLAMIVRQHHSQFAGPGRNQHNVVGSRMWPAYTFRSVAVLCAVAAVTFLLGGLAQVNPIWTWGKFNPSTIMSPSVSDWYIAWIEGGLRLFPPFEPRIFGHLIPSPFWAGVLFPLVTFIVLYLWPWLDRRLTGDRVSHHLTGRPREAPVRVAIGVGAMAFFILLLVAAAEEVVANLFLVPLGTIRAVMRVAVIVLPLAVAVVAYVLARRLRTTGAPSITQMSWRQAADADSSNGSRPDGEWLGGGGYDHVPAEERGTAGSGEAPTPGVGSQ